MKYDFDLFSIGAGSGGVRASRVSAALGARVAIAEAGRFGGTCVNVGCIPKKLFSYAAHFRDDLKDAADFGWRLAEPTFDWQKLLANKDREIDRLNGVYERLLLNAGVTIFRGKATIRGKNEIEINGKTVTAKHILVATGSWPQLPEIPGRELAITSNEAFFLDKLPRRALIVGGGYIGVEFASIFNGLGVETMLAYRGAHLLRGFDAELGRRLGEEMGRKGIAVTLHCHPLALTKQEDAIQVEFNNNARHSFDLVMFATSRKPNTAGLGLEAAGVKLGADGAVLVNEYSTSSVASIHAIGDVTNRLNLTPVATAEGMALARTLFGGQPTPVDHDCVPTAVFSNPNLASVGLSEEKARARFGKVDIYQTAFRSLKHTMGHSEEKIFMKLVVDTASQRVVGAHMLGPDAGEVIQGIAIAVKLGATKAQFDATIGIHPTAAEEFVTLREKTT
ncbi:MAG: glutathione-disulfide reductase [Betaproteobacteria bacterium]|nr:glutathione-disulfide reductase [Betaproteobacteria bacterium]MSQ89206.1 glutathione-disulfide reductase [Betaproteobacteria bacterium]